MDVRFLLETHDGAGEHRNRRLERLGSIEWA